LFLNFETLAKGENSIGHLPHGSESGCGLSFCGGSRRLRERFKFFGIKQPDAQFPGHSGNGILRIALADRIRTLGCRPSHYSDKPFKIRGVVRVGALGDGLLLGDCRTFCLADHGHATLPSKFQGRRITLGGNPLAYQPADPWASGPEGFRLCFGCCPKLLRLDLLWSTLLYGFAVLRSAANPQFGHCP
jgi:hypothetical protein